MSVGQVRAKVLSECVGEPGGPVGGDVSEGGPQCVIINIIVVVGRGRRRAERRVPGQKLAEINVGPGPLTERKVSPGEGSCCRRRSRSRRSWSWRGEPPLLPALSGRLLAPPKHERRQSSLG